MAERITAPVSIVSKEWIAEVEEHQKKKLLSLGTFDLYRLEALIDLLSEETMGEVEVLVSPDNVMPDGMLAGLIVIKYDGENYAACAGMARQPEAKK